MGGRIACCVAAFCVVAAGSAGAQNVGYYANGAPLASGNAPHATDLPGSVGPQMNSQATGYDFGDVRAEVETRSIGAGEPVTGAQVQTNSVMLSGIYDLPTGQALKPYVGAGFGTINRSQRIPGATSEQWTNTVEFRGGLSYDVGRAVRGLLEYRWSAGTPLAGSSTKLQFKQKGVVVGLKYTLH